MEVLLTPPLAFLVYLPLVGLLLLAGRSMAVKADANPVKRSTYASGEEGPSYSAAPGYRPFFLIAFFFAILHLGMLVLGTGTLSWEIAPYILGLTLALVALLLG